MYLVPSLFLVSAISCEMMCPSKYVVDEKNETREEAVKHQKKMRKNMVFSRLGHLLPLSTTQSFCIHSELFRVLKNETERILANSYP